jgi:hypothetical protein
VALKEGLLDNGTGARFGHSVAPGSWESESIEDLRV